MIAFGAAGLAVYWRPLREQGEYLLVSWGYCTVWVLRNFGTLN